MYYPNELKHLGVSLWVYTKGIVQGFHNLLPLGAKTKTHGQWPQAKRKPIGAHPAS